MKIDEINKIDRIKILDIQPSQFYISEEKVANIMKWFNPQDLSNFEPVPIKLLNGNIIFTDGHTRAFVAYNAGLLHIPLCWDNDELDWEEYQICVSACRRRGVKTVADLTDRTLPKDEYIKQWNGWCDIINEVIEIQRQQQQGR